MQTSGRTDRSRSAAPTVCPGRYGPGGTCASVTAPPSGSDEPALTDATAVPMRVAVTVTFWHSAIGGGSITVMVKVCVALVSTPPLARAAVVAHSDGEVGNARRAGGRRIRQRSVRGDRGTPPRTARGCRCVSAKVRACPASSGGPALRPVAHPGTDCAPAFLATVWFAPLVKLGTSLTAVTDDDDRRGGAAAVAVSIV